MKKNDYLALNLNLENTGLNPEDLRAYNITPDNTGLEEADYYKNIPQVVQRFSKDGQFDENAFNEFYKSVKRSYSKYAADDYLEKVIDNIPSSSTDIFSLGNENIADDTAYMVRSKDPSRRQIGIGNLFQTGVASFSEREVAQANKVIDENGNQLDWSPNDRGGIRALFRPTLALAEWKEGETSIENGVEVVHHAGERKYDKNGDPMYQLLGNNEVYGRDILHFSDTLTKEGSFWNKLDIFDSDGIDTSIGKTLARTAIEIAAYMSPAGPYLGALEAARALSKTIPTLTKAVNGAITNNNNNGIGRTMTSLENWASKFDRSTSDRGSAGFWTWENLANQLVDSAKQLYSQGLIQKIPYLLKTHPTIKEQKLGQLASILYMATTSADDVYGDYKLAGVSDRFAGIGALATMGAFFGFMNNEYFKTYLFSDPTLELPELRKALKAQAKVSGEAFMNTVKQNAEKEGVKLAEKEAQRLAISEGTKWYNKTYNAVARLINKVPKGILTDNPYVVRAFNEGLEEVMEEGATDTIKGITLGLKELGFNVKEDSAEDIDFGFSMQDFLTRYTTSFVGGAMGGAVFEGLTQWNNRHIKSISKLDLDEQLAWYLRNGYRDEINKWIDRWENKGRFGTKNLAMTYNIEQNGDEKSLVWDAASDKNVNQNTGIANLLRQRVATIDAELKSLGPLMLQTDNEILWNAINTIGEEAEKAGLSYSEYSQKNLRDASIDFIKQTGVDRLILSDAADLQHKIMLLNRRIQARIDTLSGNTDQANRDSEERIKNDETLKVYKKDLDAAKKALDELLSGKRASEYLELGLFAGDSTLKKLYLSDTTDENGKPTYFEDVKGWTRARYGQSYDELIKNSGEKDPDKENQTDLEEYLNAGFNNWRDATEDIRKIRGAYEVHKELSKIVTPIIQQQISDYSGYKKDTDRTGELAFINLDPTTVALELTTAAKELNDYEQANPDADLDTDEEYQRLTAKYNAAVIKDRFFTPQRFLDEGFKPESTLPTSLEQKTTADVVDALEFLKNYYLELNRKKVVSEFSEDVLERGVFNIINAMAIWSDSDKPIPINIDIASRNLLQNANDVADILETIQSNYADDEEILERVTSLEELANNFRNENIAVDASGLTLAQNILDYLGDVLTPEQRNILENKLKIATFVNNLLPHIHDDALIYSKFQKNVQEGLAAYNTLKEIISELEGVEVIGDVDVWLDHVLFDGTDFINKINEIRQIKSEGIKTPILDWIKGFNTTIAGTEFPLWDLLQREMKNLISKTTTDEYVIDNPRSVEELQFLQVALNSASAVLQGARKGGVNHYVNQLKESEKLPEIEIPELYDVYDHDLGVLYERVSALLDLHFNNHKSTIAIKKESFIKNAPKFLKAIVDKTTSEDTLLQKMFNDILGIDLSDEWNTINADRFEFDEIDETNFEDFWKAFRQWMDRIHDAVENINLEEAVQKAKDSYGRIVESKNDLLGFILTSPFTELWKFQNSEITNRDDEKVQDLDVVLVLASIIGVNPKVTFSAMQGISEEENKKPFWDQMISIIAGFAQTRNKGLFNSIVDNIYLQGKTEIENNDEISKGNKTYLLNRSIIRNAVFIDGASGTGKSTIVLRFIKQMNSKFAFTKSDGTNAVVKSLAIAKYANRAKALGDILSLTGENVLTLDDFIAKHFRSITEDDYEQNKNGESYRRRIKSEVIEELHNKFIANNTLMKDVDVLNVYVDEIGLMSEAELQLLSTFSDAGYVNLIFAGDRMQRGYTSEFDGDPVNSGITDVWMLSTPRLTTSVRANNFGMQKNLEDLEARLKILWTKWQEKPWVYGTSLQLDGVEEFKPIFSQSNSGIYGIGIVGDGDNAMNTLSQFGGTIGIITDHEADYTQYASDKVLVKSPDNVQGDEFDYVLIDIQNLPKLSTFDRLRYEYTLVSRARNGVFIVNELGDIKSNTVRADAASEVNRRDEHGEIAGDEIQEYKTWWDTLFSDDILGNTGSSSEPAEEPNPSPASGGTPTGGNPTGMPPAAPAASTFNFNGFKEEEFKQEVRKKGKDIKIPFYTKTQQREADLENYQKYHELVNTQGNSGKLIDTKNFIDWLFDPENESFFTDPSNQFSILSKLSYTPEIVTKYLEFVRNFALDYLQLSETKLKEKYSDSDSIGLKELVNDDVWHNFVDALFAEVQLNGNKLLYTVKDGNKQFVYFIVPQQIETGSINHYALPIAIINNGTLPRGWVKLKTHEEVPLVMLSSAGYKTKTLKEAVGHYADVSIKGYIVKDVPDDDKIASNEKGKQAKKFARNNIGHAHVIVSSIFNNENADPEKLLVPQTEGGKIIHMDQTALNSKERLMAVNRRFTVEQYYQHAKVLQKLWKGEITDDDIKLLEEFISTTERGRIYQARYADEGAAGVRAFRKLQLLSNYSRNNLTTAIIRWFWQQDHNSAKYGQFVDELYKWVSDTEHINHTGKIRQGGLSFTIYNDLGLPDTYYVFLKDPQTYEIVNGKNEVLGELKTEDYFNQSNLDLIRVTENILNAIDPGKQKYNYDVSTITSEIQNGGISFGLTTKSQENTADAQTFFYAPFDSDLVPFIENVYTDPKLAEFLEQDSIFKYGFLIGFAGTNDGFDSDYWLHCDLAGESTDIIEVIPPTFLIDSFESADRGSLPKLGLLNHKAETMNKEDIVVKEHLDVNNKPTKWIFETKFSTTRTQLENELGLNSVPGSEEVINIVGIENGQLILEDPSGRRYQAPITIDQVNTLLNGMQIVKVASNVKSVDETGVANIISTDEGYKFQMDDLMDDATIVFYKDGDLFIRFGNQIFKFTGVSNEFFNELSNTWVNNNSDDFYYYGSTENEDIYYDAKTKDLKIISDWGVITGKLFNISENEDSITLAYTDPRGISNQFDISKSNNDLYNKFKNLGPVKKEVSPVDVAKQMFNNLPKTVLSDPLLRENPNAWAIKHMQKLKGFYTWNSSKGKFESPKQNQIIYNFAFSGVNIPLSDIIDNLDNIEINNEYIVLSINNQRYVFTYSINKHGKYTFTPYEVSSQTKLEKMKAFLNNIADESIRENILWNIRINAGDENAFERAGEINRWYTANKNNAEIVNLIKESIDLANDLSLDEICSL